MTYDNLSKSNQPESLPDQSGGEIEFQGDYQLQDSNMTAHLSPDHYLAVAVAFSDRRDRATQQIFERRFRFNLTNDNRLEVLAPPEEWHNPRWPEQSGWQMEDIDGVMTDRGK